ncbi:hypothetical protein [Escherichia coli]|uniref:hypothetical protein n=1 Tax=Escherichia coli TaxID=562 RepID=UPI0015826C51|nr:hypothetical protein [Escherichia coli]
MSKDNDTFIPPIRPPRNSRHGEPSPELMKRLQQVTPELFAEFLMSKNAAQFCISCGFTKLTMSENGVYSGAKIPENYDSLSQIDQEKFVGDNTLWYVTPVFVNTHTKIRLADVEYKINCPNCGHISIYRARPVVAWIEENRKECKNESD